MTSGAHLIDLGGVQSPFRSVDAVVGAIGLADFGASFGELADASCGADVCAVFRIDPQGLTSVVASTASTRHELLHSHTTRYAREMHWQHDPALALILGKGGIAGNHAHGNQSGERPQMVQVDPSRIDDVVLKREFYGPAGIGDRLAIVARREGALYVVSLLRTLERGRFSDAGVRQVGSMSGTMIALAASHARMMDQAPPANTLDSVEGVELQLGLAEQGASPWRLTNRERQVCARILYGMGAIGIALDLGISECSVDTYRKRAYHRLGIATRHELLRLYLALVGGRRRLQ